MKRWIKILLAALLVTGLISVNIASAEIEKAQWKSFTPSVNESQKSEHRRVDPYPGGGIKFWARAHSSELCENIDACAGFHSRWWSWTIDNASDRRANNWQIRGTFERLEGRSGVMFGSDEPKPMHILAVLDDTSLYLIECTRDHRILHQVQLKPEHQRKLKKTIVLTLAWKRDTGTIKCFIDDTEYIDLSGITLPSVQRFGFACTGDDKPSSAVFKKIERRWSK